MPRHPEGYVSKRIAELTEDLKISVIDSAQVVHQMCSGSMDLDREELARHIEILQFYIDHWIPGNECRCEYDDAVNQLILASMCEWIQKRKESPFDIDGVREEPPDQIQFRQTGRAEIGDFKDVNGEKCSIQRSSSIGDGPRLWLGRDDNAPNHHVTGETLSPRMHLGESHVRELVKLMRHWLATDRLETK